MTKIRVGIVDDEQLFIKGMQMILEHSENIEVVFSAQNGLEFLTQIEDVQTKVDVVLLDLSMPVLDGVDTFLKLMEMKVSIKIIILTSHYNDGMIIKLLDEGASGFLAKNENPDNVILTIEKVYKNGFYINEYIMQLIRNRRLLSNHKQDHIDLTSREIDVLKLICQEYSNKDIGEKLKISTRTVEGHRLSIFEKTNCKNTAGLVIYAIEHKLIKVNISKYK